MSDEIDLLLRYRRATKREADLRVRADQASDQRKVALVEMYQTGMSYGQISEATKLSRSRVQQLVQRGRTQ